ncbi:hypothetical protein ACFQU9_36755 [Actinomadura namibiensis]|uniref:Uncharacterized protein n=1 Tax=Actinomadura namibiensis TaxID=182080 RepID=A0A7W3LWD5_ACTNM|nr:hypothetical protein [Actinomadura namibiensis]MBA8955519.1 hypothetical protein [Actinomadura namibiensis]
MSVPRDPLETTRPDPVEAPEERRSRLRPGDRRLLQLAALGVLAPALLAVQWTDETHNAARLVPPERPTVVPRGGTGDLAGARWRVVQRLAGTRPPPGGAPDTAEVRFVLAVEAGDPAAARTATGFGTRYEFHDGAGHTWSATGLAAPARPGVPLRVTVRAVVPRPTLRSLTLEVQRREATAKGPLPSLRFAP